MDEHAVLVALGIIGTVIIVSGLLSGAVERGPLSQVLVFVALGLLAGPMVLGVFDFQVESPAVRAVGVIALVLVLFTDGVKVNLGQLRTNWLLPALALGPGALLTAGLVGVAAHVLVGLPWVLALLTGALLSSTDAVLLRDVTRNRAVPLAVRHTLSVEAGMNDAVVLPATLLLALLATGANQGAGDWLLFGLRLIVIGPAMGIAAAGIAVRALSWLRPRGMVRRDYESLYSLGIAFVAFTLGEVAGGSGYIAAFAAGLTVAALDVDLCDCFLEYGETTAEMAMLLTFLLLGGPLVAAALEEFTPLVGMFAVFVLLAARPLAFLTVLLRSRASWGGRLLMAWFGPRGLNSLLLTLLALSAGVPEGDRLFGVVAVVVLASIVVHGSTATPVARWYARRAQQTELPEETMFDAGVLLQTQRGEGVVSRIEPSELLALLGSVTVVDTRRKAAFRTDGGRIPTALRIELDQLAETAQRIPHDRPVVLYCA